MTALSHLDPLIGRTLASRWVVRERLPAPTTGGNFSVGYTATDAAGERAFVKVLNFAAVFRAPNMTDALQRLTESYNFERDLVDRCGSNHLSRIVVAYEHGSEDFGDSPYPTTYIIFEPAEFDVRRALDLGVAFDLSAKLRFLHHAATGLKQLHSIGIAHQDLKPSNLLVFAPPGSDQKATAKVADLGRASDRDVAAWHDALNIAGDPTYAPPEQRYGEVYSSFAERRLACDIFQLGNLMAFVLTGETINARMHVHMQPSFAPENWGGSYRDALPYVLAAHAASIADVADELNDPFSSRLVEIIRYTTDPDINKRGHPASRRAGQPFATDRIVTELDLLSRRAEVPLKRRGA